MNESSGGIGFLGALGLIFIGLKLGGVINWSWWWVLSPLWSIAPVLLIGILFFIAWDTYKDKRRAPRRRPF